MPAPQKPRVTRARHNSPAVHKFPINIKWSEEELKLIDAAAEPGEPRGRTIRRIVLAALGKKA